MASANLKVCDCPEESATRQLKRSSPHLEDQFTGSRESRWETNSQPLVRVAGRPQQQLVRALSAIPNDTAHAAAHTAMTRSGTSSETPDVALMLV